MFKTDVQKLRNALEFTRIYKENANDIYLREAACMDFQLRHILVPMDENDGIAGRYEHDFVGFSSQVGGIYTYYFNEHEFLNAYMACKQNGEITAAEDYALQAVQAYWHEENTARKVELEFSKRYGYVPPKAFPGAGVGNCDCRVAGTNLDFEKLICLGFDGLDQEIDRKEREIESLCLKLLLQQQPVAKDLRQISAALKMITDMERIGDQAEDIAEIITFLGGRGAENSNLLREMARSTIKMVTESVDAYVKHDTALADQVIAEDDTVDDYFARVKKDLIKRIAQDPDDGEFALDLLMIAKYFERIGDHATNIAEWVIFSVTGEHKEG